MRRCWEASSWLETSTLGLAKVQTFVDPELQGQSPEGVLPLPALPMGLHTRQSQDIGAFIPVHLEGACKRCVVALTC